MKKVSCVVSLQAWRKAQTHVHESSTPPHHPPLLNVEKGGEKTHWLLATAATVQTYWNCQRHHPRTNSSNESPDEQQCMVGRSSDQNPANHKWSCAAHDGSFSTESFDGPSTNHTPDSSTRRKYGLKMNRMVNSFSYHAGGYYPSTTKFKNDILPTLKRNIYTKWGSKNLFSLVAHHLSSQWESQARSSYTLVCDGIIFVSCKEILNWSLFWVKGL